METEKQLQGNFTEGGILAPLVKFALPVLLAILLQTMYGAADLLIVGLFADAAEISAVSTGSNIMVTITSVIIGISVGTTVLIGQRIGAKQAESAGSVVGASVALFAAIGLGVAVLMQPLSPAIARLMQAPPEALDSTIAYMRICAGGAVFIVGYNVLGGIFRGIGNARLPLLTVLIACVLNVLCDLLMVAVFRMGAAGAAIATVFAQAVSVMISLVIIKGMSLPFPFSAKLIRFNRAEIRSVLKLGWPIAVQDLLVSISFLVIGAIVNSLGVLASAGVGVAEKVCSFIMLVPSAFSQSMSAFVAQNVGAKRMDRANRALGYGILISLAAGVVMGYVTFFHGDMLAGLFANNSDVVQNAWQYLKSYAIDCIFVSFLFCFTGYFNGVGKTGFVMLQGMIGAFLVRIPVSFVMSRITPVSLFLIGLATPCSSLVQITLCGIYFAILKKKTQRELPDIASV